MFELVVRVGRDVVERRVFDREQVNVGRGKEMDLRLAEPAASKHHVTIRKTGGAYVLHDLESRNGTWVNEERVGTRPLNDGDRIRIGSFILEFKPRDKGPDGTGGPDWIAAAAPLPQNPGLNVVLGTTYTIGPGRERETCERSATVRAYLEVSGGAAVPIESDVVLFGKGAGCHVKLREGRPIAATLVRGPGGFSLYNLDPLVTIAGNLLMGERLFLKDGDRVTIGRSFGFTFRLGALGPQR